jgi:hypothetical protein
MVLLVGGGRQGVDDFNGGGEEHRVAAQTRGVAKGNAHMGFPQADATNPV